MMEEIGSEVSHKIRAAIKAKLIELGAYIDDELPDYIMVMVANKRSRHQMDEDLQLFLGSNTKTFTTWLHAVLQKLQEVTVANFEMKKDVQIEKTGKRKSSNSESSRKDRKSSEERSKTSKKHSKKHKEGKKMKKSKHKSKDKEKSKNIGKKQCKTETAGNDKEKTIPLNEDTVDFPLNTSIDSRTKEKDREENDNCNESSQKRNKLKRFRCDRSHSSSKCSSASHFTEEPVTTNTGNGHEDGTKTDENKTRLIGDEFNIEPLQPDEIGDQLTEKVDDIEKNSSFDLQAASGTSTGMTIKAPTRELLKEHDKIHSETDEIVLHEKKNSDQDSNDSLSPEEIRKQLLLSRTKMKLEQSKIPGRMKSNSPEAEILVDKSNGNQDQFSSHGISRSSKMSTHQKEYEEELKTRRSNSNNHSRENTIEGKRNSPPKRDNENSQSEGKGRNDQKRNVISISKSLEMEKNLGLRSEEYKKSICKTSSSSKKKPVPSRIVTIPEPEAPEISSIVKVKPREYIPKDKQANKALILKAVADAEKSIATVQSRNDGEVDTKKSVEGIFTKNLRGKRYEKLAVTLSNVQSGVDDRDKSKRMVSVDSENTNALDLKTESFKGSELSQGFRSIQELTLKNISNKSEDQFISSKTSAMEKNDKYIHCWLEGVEKAVKDEEIVNPSEIDDFHGNFSEEGEEEEEDESIRDESRKKKKQKTDEGDAIEQENLKKGKAGEKTNTSTKSNKEEGPQIVVTLDGLTSKALKDILLRNRDGTNNPLLATKKVDKNKESVDVEEESGRFRYKEAESSKNAGTSRRSDGEARDKGAGFEKISERFGRINKTSESHEFKEKYYEFEKERYEKKYLKYQGTDKEKHYEKLKDKYANAGESKNKMLIARLSEKFGQVDREFENKKRKYVDNDVDYSYSSRRVDRNAERSGRYRELNRKSSRTGFSK